MAILVHQLSQLGYGHRLWCANTLFGRCVRLFSRLSSATSLVLGTSADVPDDVHLDLVVKVYSGSREVCTIESVLLDLHSHGGCHDGCPRKRSKVCSAGAGEVNSVACSETSGQSPTAWLDSQSSVCASALMYIRLSAGRCADGMRLCAVAGTLSRLVRRLPAPLDELKTAAQLLLLTV